MGKALASLAMTNKFERNHAPMSMIIPSLFNIFRVYQKASLL